MMKTSVYIGYEPRELDAFMVAGYSIRKNGYRGGINGLILEDMQRYGHYERETIVKDGRLWDVISDAPMATQFALTRFLVPMLARNAGDDWALFIDCDMMIRADLNELFALADDSYAVMCVKHEHEKHAEGIKMDNCLQVAYPRKNWSSVMLINCKHPAWDRLTKEDINTKRGLWLHQLTWMQDDEIGALPGEWNHLVGVDDPRPDAKIVHFTLGVPSMLGYENCEHADEWKILLKSLVR